MYQEQQVQRTWGRNGGGRYLRTSEGAGSAAAVLVTGEQWKFGPKRRGGGLDHAGA